jgi:hypothetical protein
MCSGKVLLYQLSIFLGSDRVIIAPVPFQHDRVKLIVVVAMDREKFMPDNASELSREPFCNRRPESS